MRIALITIPRSGSSFYSRVLAKQYKVKHVGELFVVNDNPSRELLGKRFKGGGIAGANRRVWLVKYVEFRGGGGDTINLYL